MRILFVGETWQGSNARSLREALSRRLDVTVAEVADQHRIPCRGDLPLRIGSRLSAPVGAIELRREILQQCEDFQPDVAVVYKGSSLDAEFITMMKELSGSVVNVFPDYSPHAFGHRLSKAIGAYDLVVSTKPFQPPMWSSVYGYANRCVFVPHGYDSSLHLRNEINAEPDFDVVLVAGGRPEYHALIQGLAEQPGLARLNVAIVGGAWEPVASRLPKTWRLFPAKFGVSYVDWLRRGKIAIAPVQRRVVVDGVRQPGDEDTARTYELAAAHCFFVHRRTAFVGGVYDEATEAPMFDDCPELARKILHFLERPDERTAMAEAAHRRAVPAYSLDARAQEIVAWLSTL